MRKLRFLITLLAFGIAAPGWSQESGPSNMRVRKCDPSHHPTKGRCVSAIVFGSTRNHPTSGFSGAEIYLMTMNEDGTFNVDDAARLTQDEIGINGFVGANLFPKLSPEGKRIVFDSNRNRLPSEPGNTSDLFLMKADGKAQTLLIRGSSATWSPNGKYIAFHRSASGTGLPIKPDPGAATADSDIFIMRVPDLDGNVIEEPINITNTLLFIEDDADWSPDGQKIVFTRHPTTDPAGNSPNAEICEVTLETLDVTCLTNNGEEERGPTWSPDGTRIAYMCRNQTTSIFDICVMDADGAGQTHLTDNSVLPQEDRFHATPTWSPDGTKIVFTRGPAQTNAQLWVINADGPAGETPLPHDSTLTQGVNTTASWGQLWVGGRRLRHQQRHFADGEVLRIEPSGDTR